MQKSHRILKTSDSEWFKFHQPNVKNYDQYYSQFKWQDSQKELSGLPNGKGLNIVFEAVDRHVRDNKKYQVAFRWLGRQGQARDFTYQDLYELSNRFANVLNQLGIKKSETVFSLLGRVPELYITALGTLKHRAVFCPLFSAFGPEPIRARLVKGDARVLVTDEMLYKKKIEQIKSTLPNLKYIILVSSKERELNTGVLNFQTLINSASPQYEIQVTHAEDPALLHFTSGTTGLPKGALHVHRAVLAHYWTGKIALDFHDDDIFWCTADPGWVTGTSYGIISPLTNGITSIIDEEDFNAQRWYQILSEQKVSVWYTAPTALRMAMKSGLGLAKEWRFPNLRFIASVGEPLNPEVVTWGLEAFGVPIHDNWWQTETGGIMIANYPTMDIKPGSMGKPLPGVEAAIIRKVENKIEVVQEPHVEGELALKAGWPSMFRTYIHEEERYKKCFSGQYYLTGDLAKKDEDGYFWFVGRADDIIKSSGHLIGPFEVESALMEHPAVAEAGVIGKPDPVALEIVKAFVVLKLEQIPSEELQMDIHAFARKRLGPAIAPKEIVFVADLPKTRSGKIMRRLLKARELGLPEGDTSTLEGVVG